MITDLEKIEFLLKLLGEQTFTLKGVEQSAHLIESYKWLLKLKQAMKEGQNADSGNDKAN